MTPKKPTPDTEAAVLAQVAPQAKVYRSRPYKLKPEAENAIVTAVRAGAPFEAAAKAAGVSSRTLRRWRALESGGRPEFVRLVRAIEKAEAEAHVHAMATIRAAMKTTWQAAAWYLERTMPDRYSLRTRQEISVVDRVAYVQPGALRATSQALERSN